MSDSEEDEIPVCPLCVEEMDLSDKNFLPCPCGYRVCMWCWHHIRENLNGLCPACRTPYNSDPHAFSAVDRHEIVKKNREKKQKEKIDKKVVVVEKPTNPAITVATAAAVAIKSSSSGVSSSSISLDRKNLHNFRVVQRNLVYVIGLPLSASNEELLRKAEYFGQYGKINKVVVHRNNSISQTTVSAYVTFAYKEDAKAAIQALDGYWMEGHPLRASFGTTKYCNNFIRNVPCSNPECVYLHELGDEDDRFTKEEIQAGHTKLTPTPGKDQSIVTGCGGPSGTGKRPAGETILPPPVFIQDNVSANKPVLSRNSSINIQSIMESKEVPEETTNVGTSAVTPRESTKGVKDKEQNRNEIEAPSIEEKNIQDQPSSIGERRIADESVQDDYNDIEQVAPDNASFSNQQWEIETSQQKTDNPAFNGITWNAVFPVPSSSLRTPVWSTVLRISHSNFASNPFDVVNLSLSDLLELTLPPVDTMASGLGSKNNSHILNANLSKQQLEGTETSRTYPSHEIPPISKPSHSHSSGTSEEAIANYEVSGKNGFAGQNNTNGNGSVSGFNALRQLFPGVNLSYGVQGRF